MFLERVTEMETQEIINAISSVGFPIVASAALFWMVNTTMSKLTDAINDLTNYLKKGSDQRDTI